MNAHPSLLSAALLDPSRRWGLVVLGGGMRGVGSGAALVALHDAGVAHRLSVIVGLSAGAAAVAYFAAGATPVRRGLSIFYNQLPPDFMTIRYGKPVMRLAKLEHALRHGTTALPPPHQWELKVPVWVGALRADRVSRFVQLAAVQDAVPWIMASCALPLFVRGGVRVDNHTYHDGEAQLAVQTCVILEEAHCTDVLILPTIDASILPPPRDAPLRLLDRILTRTPPSSAAHEYSLFVAFLASRLRALDALVHKLHRKGMRSHLLWLPPSSVTAITQDPQALWQAACVSYCATLSLLGHPVPHPPPLIPLLHGKVEPDGAGE